MTKLRITVVLLALVGALNSWSQGFGNRELINADWYFNLGILSMEEVNILTIRNGESWNYLMTGVWKLLRVRS